jgi:hypothetical protein
MVRRERAAAGSGGRGRTAGRVPALMLALLAVLPARPATAQDSTEVRLEVALTRDSTPAGARSPVVRTRNLIAETPWLSTLRQGLPVRLQYRLELWRSREGWFDVLERKLDWDVVVRHEPLLDQFSVVRVLPPNRVLQNRYATPGALAAALSTAYQYTIAPSGAGTYYYSASLDVGTLSDSDLDELERFLKGELGADSEGGGLGRTARRLVLRLAGLPRESLSARSAAFVVRESPGRATNPP